MKILRGRLFH